MSGAIKRLAGPAYIGSSAANIYVPSSSLIYGVVTHIHIVNATAGAATFSLYIGATGGSAGGTELEKTYSVAANSDYDRYWPGLKLVSTDFLTGVCETGASTLVITVTGEEHVV
jgi:hypothetical protein